MADDQKAEYLKTTANEIIKFLGFQAELTIAKDSEGLYQLELQGDGLGVLIGYHGEILSSLQLLLSLAAFRKFNEWVPVTVDIDNYRKGREERLRELAEHSIDKVRFLQREIALPPMPANERRIIHLVAANFNDVVSESRGEGRDRYVVLALKSEDTGPVLSDPEKKE